MNLKMLATVCMVGGSMWAAGLWAVVLWWPQ